MELEPTLSNLLHSQLFVAVMGIAGAWLVEKIDNDPDKLHAMLIFSPLTAAVSGVVALTMTALLPAGAILFFSQLATFNLAGAVTLLFLLLRGK